MKLFFSIFFLCSALSTAQAVTTSCPSLAGEYVRSCPLNKISPYYSLKIRQSGCEAIGFQTIQYSKWNVTSSFSPVRWEVIGEGKLLKTENNTSQIYSERFYESSKLYSLTHEKSKIDQVTQLKNMEFIDLLRDRSLYIVDAAFGSSSTWTPLNRCP